MNLISQGIKRISLLPSPGGYRNSLSSNLEKLQKKVSLFAESTSWFSPIFSRGNSLVSNPVFSLVYKKIEIEVFFNLFLIGIAVVGLNLILKRMDDIGHLWNKFRPVPLRHQLPGFRNEGNTCFINASLQSVLSIPSYKDALQDTAQKELGYYAAWDKLYSCIEGKATEPLNWTEDEIKGVLICLARGSKTFIQNNNPIPPMTSQEIQANKAGWLQPKILSVIDMGFQKYSTDPQAVANTPPMDLGSYLESQPIENRAFFKKLQEFIEADQKETPWPSVSDVEESFQGYVQYWKEDRNILPYFDALSKNAKDYKAAFLSLDQGIKDYEKRKKLLSQDWQTAQVIPWSDIDPPTSLKLNTLRNFLGKKHLYTQEDAEEFISKILNLVRRCEHPSLISYPTHFQKLEEFNPSDEDIKAKALAARSEKHRTDPLPQDRMLKKQDHDLFIRLTCDRDNDTVAQQLLNDWNQLKAIPIEDSETVENLVFYREGNYYIAEEKVEFDELPDHVVIHLKRFNYHQTAEKITTNVTFSEDIYLQKQCYRIYSAVIHLGTSLQSGHYTAIVRDERKESTWWYCDDSHITKATESQLKLGLEKGYLYFLRKVKASRQLPS